MEFIEGKKVLDILDDESYAPPERARIAKIGADALFKMIFSYGFFHADPHPANIFVIDSNTISFLDFGITGRINRKMKGELVDIILAVLNKDAEKVADTVLSITEAEDVNKDDLVWEIEDLIENYYGQPLENINMGTFIQDLTAVSKRYGIKMPKYYTLLGKSILMIEGIGRQLDPGFNAVEYTKPYVRQMVKERMSPVNMAKRWYESVTQAGDLLLEMPRRLDSILSRTSKKGFKFGVDRETTESLTHSFERSANRLAFAIVSASMVLASSVLFQADIGPRWQGLPLFGLLLFLVSFIFGVSLIYAIYKGGKL
jgi:ubiquinone biosynthesis protein